MAQAPGDPKLDFSTYFGGSSVEAVTAVRMDTAGNIYFAGLTRSADFPTTTNLFRPSALGAGVGFIVKLRADRSIAYSTYLDRPVVALAVDPAGNAIVADNLPAGNRFSGPLGDAVLTKINPSGSEVIYSVRLAGRALDEVAALEIDSTGAVIVAGQTNSTDFPLVNPLPSNGSAANAFVAKLDALGRIVFSTVWGGSGDDSASAVAIDRSGDIVIAGMTASPDFVTTPNAYQKIFAPITCSGCGLRRDAFLLRLSADGQSVRYSTLFGGSHDESVVGLALDQFGSPHIAGVTRSIDLPLKNALQTTCDSTFEGNGCSGYISKLTPDGAALQYSTYFGSRSYYVTNLGRVISGLSVDPDGNLLAVGTTQGSDLPVWRAVQPVNGSGPFFKSTDDGVTWNPSSAGMAGTGTWSIQGAGQVLYATPLGEKFFRSGDGGASWQGSTKAGSIAVDPLASSTLYAATSSGAYKSTDGGQTWSRLALEEPALTLVAIAPSAPSHVYMASNLAVFHTENGGLTWSRILDAGPNPLPIIQSLAVDPQNAHAVHATLSDRSVMRRENGRQWTALTPLECSFGQLVFGSGLPPVIYARSCGKVFKSVDRGGSWREIGFSNRTAAAIALDPFAPNVVYVASAQNGVYRSRDYGETWTQIRGSLEQDVRAIYVDRSTPGTIYIGSTHASNAFLTQLSPLGVVMASSYLGGVNAYGQGLAVDRSGTIIVAGMTGNNFPVVQPIQGTYRGESDVFIARIR